MSTNNIRIVLHETSHPGNIGSAARAMKTMGLTKLTLVNPKHLPNDEAVALASGACDVLEQAIITDNLSTALTNTQLILGTSARLRSQQTPRISSKEAAKLIVEAASQGQHVAVLFGPERTGLDNQTLSLCHYHIHIPANPDYSSVNLAQAVQIIAYEIYQASLSTPLPHSKAPDFTLASFSDMQRLFEHLEITLEDLDMLRADNPKGIMQHLTQLFRRAKPYSQEVNLLRGFLKQAQLKSTGRVKVKKSAVKADD